MPFRLRFVVAVFVLMVAPASANDSEPPDRDDTVRVFLDCPSCDQSYIRTEVTFVTYVRDRLEADVHLLITTQSTGAGGVEYTLTFIGLQEFAGVDNKLTYSVPMTATPDERRRGLASVLKLGLVRYVTGTPIASRLSLRVEGAPHTPAAPPGRDRWNYWVFRISGNGGFDGEQSTSERRVSMNVSANRTTEAWKAIFTGGASYRSERFDLEEEETLTVVRRSYDGRALVTKSLTPHWSIGGTAALSASTFNNYDLRSRIGPGLEYNIFPYPESTRRIMTLFYTVGLQTADYSEETVFGKLEETLLDHQFELSMGLRQPWGTASAAFETSQYLNRDGKWRISGFGALDVRLFKGFSVFLDGRLSRRRDQLSLRRGEATTEEILIHQRELATDYAYDFGFGLTYSFGSIFNSIVNPRFRNAGGF